MTDRLSIDEINSDQLDALCNEIARLRAGEEDGYDPRCFPTPGQWIALWNQATPEKRLEVAERAISNQERATRCYEMDHEKRLSALHSAATEATDLETTARVFAGLHRSAEQDVTRVIELYERWVQEGAPPLGVPLARWWDKRLVELREAIVPPTDQPKEH